MEKLIAKMDSGEGEGSVEAFKYNVDMQVQEILHQGKQYHMARRKSMINGHSIGFEEFREILDIEASTEFFGPGGRDNRAKAANGHAAEENGGARESEQNGAH